MKKRTEIEVARAAMLKAIRANVRLKYALLADEELNRVLPDAEQLFDTAVHKGELIDGPTIVELVKGALDAEDA